MGTKIVVPTIDISPLLSLKPRSHEGLTLAVEQIRKACEDWGFFYIVGHQVPPTLVDDVTQEGRTFFGLPNEEKSRVARFDGNFQGYSDNELTKQKVDWKQIFDFSSDSDDTHSRNSDNVGIHGTNQWPSIELLPKFRITMAHYFEEMEKLAHILMKAIFRTMIPGREDQFVEHCFGLTSGSGTSFARLNYYPIYPQETSDRLGVGPHSDAGVLTILYQQEGVSSLQVLKDEEFYDVPPIPGSFVVNVGDMTQVWSNGRYKAPIHRVLANHTQSRFSVPFFLNPNYECEVEPLEGCVSELNPKLYRAIMWGDFRRGRVLGDYADIGEELQISHYLL